MPPKVTKGGPRPKRKDYKNDTEYNKAVEEWLVLNPQGATSNTSSLSVTNQGVVDTKDVESQYRTQTGVRTDWKSFTDGTFNLQEGDATTQSTPFVTAIIEGYGENKPTPVVILPDPNGKGFIVEAREVLLQKIVTEIKRNPNNASYWKTQLQNYYRTQDAFSISLSGGPVTDKDTEFIFALRRALSEISSNNLSAGTENVKNNVLNPSGFYDINTWLTSRTPVPGRQSESSTTRNFTLREDAIADFMREVQQQVGDPTLVDNVDALAEAYWEKVQSEERKRMGRSSSVYDPITRKSVTVSTGFQMPSAQLLKEWRVGFILNGATKKKKIISTGIANVSAEDLQDAGGDLGDNYTKLKSYSYEYGVPLSDSQLRQKAAEASIAGGSIEEQKRSIQLASRARYKGLDSYIQAGLKVSDIADQYRKIKTTELELADGSVDIFDADVQSAITGDKLLSPIDYTALIRSNPAWAKTRAANESAAGFIDTILKSWGKVG